MGSPLGPSLASAFLGTMNKIGQIVAIRNINHCVIDGILRIYLYFLNHLITQNDVKVI